MPAQPVDVHNHELFGFLNLGHGVCFQPQLFSDKSFYEHLGPFPSLCSGEQLRRIEAGRGAAQLPASGHLIPVKGLQPQLHFSERSRNGSYPGAPVVSTCYGRIHGLNDCEHGPSKPSALEN